MHTGHAVGQSVGTRTCLSDILTINGIELYVPQRFRNTIVSLFENISLIGFPLFPRNEKIPTRQSLSRLESGAAGPTGRSKSD